MVQFSVVPVSNFHYYYLWLWVILNSQLQNKQFLHHNFLSLINLNKIVCFHVCKKYKYWFVEDIISKNNHNILLKFWQFASKNLTGCILDRSRESWSCRYLNSIPISYHTDFETNLHVLNFFYIMGTCALVHYSLSKLLNIYILKTGKVQVDKTTTKSKRFKEDFYR